MLWSRPFIDCRANGYKGTSVRLGEVNKLIWIVPPAVRRTISLLLKVLPYLLEQQRGGKQPDVGHRRGESRVKLDCSTIRAFQAAGQDPPSLAE
jgi:hypothetical protein